MLLKCSQSEKRSRANASSKQQRSTASTMKLTIGTTLAPRLHRKAFKGFAVKKTPLSHHHSHTGEVNVDPCDNSNDSGLGFDNHLEYHLVHTTVHFSDQESAWTDEHPEVKRKKLEIKLESDDANEDFTFPETVNRRKKEVDFRGSTISAGIGDAGRPTVVNQRLTSANVRTMQRQSVNKPPSLTGRRNAGPASLSTQLTGMSSDGKTHLQILCQPEQQHRARYQTEGSRGAVKDRSGNGFPIVKLVGYNKPATLQVFIGTDLGRVAPHMFYQACRVSGKNSTPCVEKKIDGTIVIEVDFDPAKDMVVTCDCVGILKERNVDVEHRFPDQSGARNKKKSTRCRMVFRTTITHDDGSTEVLQTTSQPIVCTQPPGVPEICKKSISACPSSGGLELFILGKNFLKDTRVVFQQSDCEPHWEETVQPDKEYLQQTHLVCVVPPYRRIDNVDPVTVKLMVSSSGKMSEPHTFTYLPTTNPVVATTLQVPVGAAETQTCATLLQPALTSGPAQLSRVYGKAMPAPPPSTILLSGGHRQKPPSQLLANMKSQYLQAGGDGKDAVMMWPTTVVVDSKAEEPKPKLLPPPPLLPLAPRAFLEPPTAPLKTEMTDEGPEDLRTKQPQPPPPLATVADLSSTQSPSMATFRQFVSDSSFLPLPAQSAHSIEKYLSHIESKEAPPPFAVINGLSAEPAATPPSVGLAELVMRTSTEKLDALVNSAAETHMIGVAGPVADVAPAEAVMLPSHDRSPIAIKSMILGATSAPETVILRSPDTSPPVAVSDIITDLAPPIAVKQMIMDVPPAACTSPIAVKQMMMDAPNTACTSPIAVKQIMMDAPNTACTSPIAVKQMMMDAPNTACTSPIAVQQMMMDAPNTACTSPIAVKQMMMDAPNTACTSPIAVKQMMMDAPNTACTSPIAVKQMMMDAPNTACTSPIAVKQMMMDAPNTACTSPIAVKQMMMDAPNTACTSPIAVKQMMMDAPPATCTSPIAVKQMMVNAPPAECTSPIAVKQMMMDVPNTACTSPIAIKTMLLGGTGTPLDSSTIAIKDILNSAPTDSSPLCSMISPTPPPTVAVNVSVPPPTAADATLLDAVYAAGGDSTRLMMTTADKMADPPQIPAASTAALPAPPAAATVQKKCEEGMLPQELTQMSDNDLISYINPSCFDAV